MYYSRMYYSKTDIRFFVQFNYTHNYCIHSAMFLVTTVKLVALFLSKLKKSSQTFHISNMNEQKRKDIPLYAMNAYGGSRGTATLILNLCTRRR